MPTSKGPWTIDRGQIRDADGNSLASVPYALGDDQDRANQRLMCAAPDLLRACRMILTRLDVEAREQGEDAVFLGNALRPVLRDAIAKATDDAEPADVVTEIALRDMLSLLLRTCYDSLRHGIEPGSGQYEALEETTKQASALLRGLR